MSTWTNILDLVYPIGSVYVAYTSTSPATRFGGTWTAITGRFPYFNAGTGTGGSNTHTLTISQIPKHNHLVSSPPLIAIVGTVTSGGAGTWFNASVGETGLVANSKSTGLDKYVTNAGSGSSHNNMPAYQTLYAWRRTA